MSKETVCAGMSANLIHPGHLKTISRAAELGKVTIGLLTDEAVANCKRLPYMPFDQCKMAMEHIKCVCRVIPQTTLDYAPNLTGTAPDVRRSKSYRLLKAKSLARRLESHNGLIGLIVETLAADTESRRP